MMMDLNHNNNDNGRGDDGDDDLKWLKNRMSSDVAENVCMLVRGWRKEGKQ